MSTLGDSPARTVVHLLRHGEVDNPGHILYGRLPGYHLSDLGRRMADLAARHLSDHDIVHLVSSPLERAQETAAPLAAAHELPVHLDERAIEAANDFEGMAVAGGRGLLRSPRMLPRLWNPARPSWGEPYAAIAARMLGAITDARRAAAGHEAVIVSHQSPIWMVRRRIEGKSFLHNPARRECALASLTSLTYLGDELLSVSYSEPAAELLPQAQTGAGA
ncbi:MAG: histidine phosphatase family protein [Tetrasphaera sp.]|nr:histidine phosphatase family protein [Tetrasphaera sp.]